MFAEFFNLPKSTPIRALTFGYILALLIIACMSLIIHYGIGEIIKQQNNRDVVFASRQLKLIPLISLNIRNYIETKNEVIKQKALEDVDMLRSAHKQLFSNDIERARGRSKTFYSVQVEESQRKAKQDIDSFIVHARSFLNSESAVANKNNEHFKSIQDLMQGSLLQNVDSVNIAYEAESLEYIRRLQVYQYIALIVILITLLLEALLIFMPLVKRVRVYANKLESLARTDALTGVDNRRSIMEKGLKEVGRSKRYKKPLSVALLDIDHFKVINDEHGHVSGDMVLKEIVQTIADSIRLEDELGRYGGEEFIILLPSTEKNDAHIVMDRVRKTIELKEFRIQSGKYIKVTISIGIAEVSLEEENTLDPSIRRADVVLYKAKEAGRNQIKIF